MSEITPTIGRRIWFFPGASERNLHRLDDSQPCDAGIVYVHPDGSVNLLVTDHFGVTCAKTAEIIPEGDAVPAEIGYAQWMPYQVKADAGRKEHEAQANGAAVHKLMGPVPVSDVAFIGRLEPTVHQPKPSNTVTPEQIQALKDRVIYHTAPRLGDLTSTFVHAYLFGKFYLATGHSACVDPANYNAEKGKTIAQRNCEYAVTQKLWELEGYALWNTLQ